MLNTFGVIMKVSRRYMANVLLVLYLGSLSFAESAYLRAVFDMNYVKGEVRFYQEANNIARISPNLTGIQSPLSWKIHKNSMVYRGNSMRSCNLSNIGPIFHAGGNMSRICAVGDQNCTHGNSSTSDLFDPQLRLNGSHSIFGRSLVLYVNGSMPWACALIDYDYVVTAVTTFRSPVSGITGTVRLRQPRDHPNLDTSVEVDLFYSNDMKMATFNWTVELANSTLPQDGRPSFEASSCEISTKKIIAKNVEVSLATPYPSPQKLHFSTSGLPLTGALSIIGQTIVLKQHGKPVVCGSIVEVLPIEGEAVFDVMGVNGTIHFKQDSELAPTVVTVNLKGLQGNGYFYHVHVYRVLNKAIKRRENYLGMCANGYVAGHWKPYMTTSAKPGNATVDKYEVGDLSGKYGLIGGKDTVSFSRKDYNLPLFGRNSIMFRSIVIHYKNSTRWLCANINPKNATFLFKGRSNFVGPEFNGSIDVEQASFLKMYGASHITSFFIDLWNLNRTYKTRNHNWHIHAKDIVRDQLNKTGKRCLSAAGHYNPYNVSLKANYPETCGPMNLLRCELGDTSSKIGKYTIGDGKNRFTESENYFASVNTILGRSIVVHAEDSGAPRVGCANMKLISKSFVRKELVFRKTSAKNKLAKLLASELGIHQWRVVQEGKIVDYMDRCQKASIIFIDSVYSDLGKRFEDLKSNWSSSPIEFMPKRQCSSTLATSETPTLVTTSSGNAINHRWTTLILIITLLLPRTFW